MINKVVFMRNIEQYYLINVLKFWFDHCGHFIGNIWVPSCFVNNDELLQCTSDWTICASVHHNFTLNDIKLSVRSLVFVLKSPGQLRCSHNTMWDFVQHRRLVTADMNLLRCATIFFNFITWLQSVHTVIFQINIQFWGI